MTTWTSHLGFNTYVVCRLVTVMLPSWPLSAFPDSLKKTMRLQFPGFTFRAAS